MKIVFTSITAIAFLVSANCVRGAEPLPGGSPVLPVRADHVHGDEAAYECALEAMGEGIPEVAVEKFKRILAGDLPPGQRAAISVKLGEALLVAGRPEEALKVVSDSGTPETDFLKAQALSALGRWSDALPLCQALSTGSASSLTTDASACLAEVLHALQRTEEAVRVLESVQRTSTEVMKLRLADFYIETNRLKEAGELLKKITPDSTAATKAKEYVAARLLLAEGNPEVALPAFEGIVRSPEGVSESVYAGATLGMAEARILVSGPETADNVLEDFIWHYPTSAYLEMVFCRLDQVYALEETPSDSELQNWTQKPPDRRAGLAAFYLAKAQLRDKKEDRALRQFAGFVRDYPSHPLVAEASLCQGNILFENGKLDSALQAFGLAMRKAPNREFLAGVELAAGLVYFRQQQFVLAANLFRSAAGHSEKLWQTAMFNSALAWLNQRNYEKFLEDYKELSKRFPESDLRSDLLLEEGLLQARSGNERATRTLQLFLRDFPNHPRIAEAQLALAEISYVSSDFASAGDYLKAVNEATSDAKPSDRSDYLSIFLTDSAGRESEGKVIQECLKFLKDHPTSVLVPEVQMKLGQIYFRREDFANAQTRFELLARESPGSPLAEGALFLAGQASMRSMNVGGVDRALEIFEEVAKYNGPLKLYARQQQAIAQTLLGKENEAILLYDNILGDKPDMELRCAALCGKGDNLFALAGKDGKLWERAVAVFDELANLPEVALQWRNQALYKKGKCLEKQSQPAEALAVFYDVLQAQGISGQEPEYFWYYKAGFDAAGILEAQQQWKSAIGIYQKMANIEGPRREEARARANRLRLEHFIWED